MCAARNAQIGRGGCCEPAIQVHRSAGRGARDAQNRAIECQSGGDEDQEQHQQEKQAEAVQEKTLDQPGFEGKSATPSEAQSEALSLAQHLSSDTLEAGEAAIVLEDLDRLVSDNLTDFPEDMRPALTYEQKNDRGAWARISTHPGKVTENADQAIARDVLARGLRKARRNGIPVCLHVHDQIVGLVKESEAEDKLLVLKECMEEEIGWAPGLPLKAAGHISKWFVKD